MKTSKASKDLPKSFRSECTKAKELSSKKKSEGLFISALGYNKIMDNRGP